MNQASDVFIFSEDNKEILGCVDHKFDKKLVIPEGVESIGYRAFDSNQDIKTLILPSTLKEIKELAFSTCMNLKEIIFSDESHLKTIKMNAFSCCNSLEYIKLPKGLETIETYAFSHTPNLKEVYIPSTVNNIMAGAFRNYRINIIIDKNNKKYSDMDCNVIYDKETNTIVMGNENGIVPEGTCYVGPFAFSGLNFGDKIIKLPESLISIENHAFAGSHFNSIVFPYKKFRRIEDYAFNECINKQEKLEFFGNSLKKIGENAFGKWNSLQTINIQSPNVKLGSRAFYKCENLKTIYYFSNNKISIKNNPFVFLKNIESIYINKKAEDVLDKELPIYGNAIRYKDVLIEPATIDDLIKQEKSFSEVNNILKNSINGIYFDR